MEFLRGTGKVVAYGLGAILLGGVWFAQYGGLGMVKTGSPCDRYLAAYDVYSSEAWGPQADQAFREAGAAAQEMAALNDVGVTNEILMAAADFVDYAEGLLEKYPEGIPPDDDFDDKADNLASECRGGPPAASPGG